VPLFCINEGTNIYCNAQNTSLIQKQRQPHTQRLPVSSADNNTFTYTLTTFIMEELWFREERGGGIKTNTLAASRGVNALHNTNKNNQ
jgi:hypothetical protein